ncbi:adenylyl-sulfate kinase [Saccharophagus degradans]|uniref:adenylyl-sulfate kinase n=1 Tax=Saccharophagus degradans TaxID=86304 RepID=UPI001C097A5D|nr:adenylyl-sulfate kinase [Saccharophagus degradans]MBU2985796.1 adenylyl-sulfate kinase [Saccharophagus degradans]
MDIVWHDHKITKEVRQEQHGHKSCVIWFTGLSGSGKSSVASELERALVQQFNAKTYLLDGDNVRHGLCKDLGFTADDRVENIRRVGEISKLFVDAGLITLSAFISPFRTERRLARELLEEGEFIEVFVDTPLSECEKRDPKGLYQKAREGKIKNFTGIDSKYETPENPEIHLENGKQTIQESVGQIITYLKKHNYLASL